MRTFTDTTDIENNHNTIVTIGTFDGIHLGHQKILNLVVQKSRKNKSRNFVITFDPHPRTVVSNNYNIHLITSLEEKIELLSEIGIENLLVINFNKEFSQTTYDRFIKEIIYDKIGCSHIIIGYDHKFGKNRDGNAEKLKSIGKNLDFDVTTVGPVTIKGDEISSTKIRKILLNGEIDKANEYLGRFYSISGIVNRGAGRGREMGFPTANINIENEFKLIPQRGVYIVKCRLEDSTFFGLLNIGLRPTFENNDQLIVEVYIFDLNRDLYNQKIKIEFLMRLRDEKKFGSKDELINQIKADEKQALDLIKQLTNN